jgi:hypothetical protein
MKDLSTITRPFLPSQIKFIGDFAYPKIESYLDRLNETDWSSKVTAQDVTLLGSRYIATITIDLEINGDSRSGVGSDMVDLDNPKVGDPDKACKTALAQATKKACNQFGMGRELWVTKTTNKIRKIKEMSASQLVTELNKYSRNLKGYEKIEDRIKVQATANGWKHDDFPDKKYSNEAGKFVEWFEQPEFLGDLLYHCLNNCQEVPVPQVDPGKNWKDVKAAFEESSKVGVTDKALFDRVCKKYNYPAFLTNVQKNSILKKLTDMTAVYENKEKLVDEKVEVDKTEILVIK